MNSPKDRFRLQAYMASALSRLTEDQRKAVFFLSEAVDEVCRRHDIFLYQPRKVTDPVNNPNIPDETVYVIDRAKVASSDLVIMLCDYASYGAGQENEIAAQAGVAIVYLIEKGNRIPRMLAGSFGQTVKVEYSNPDDLKEKLNHVLGLLVPRLLERKRELGIEEELGVGQRVRELRHNRALDEREVAEKLWVKRDFVEMLERETETVSNPSLVHLKRLAEVLGVSISYLLEGGDMAQGDRIKQEAVMNLWSIHEEEHLTTEEAGELLEEFLGELRMERATAVGARGRTAPSNAEWKKRLENLRKRKGGLF